ncbi:MAG TPA: BamA/TamA family outer membrane protein, partial [Armatimonadota bacterium]|nr:BamA/TamA family outer membrane protein [Armatimonadota bacterium]
LFGDDPRKSLQALAFVDYGDAYGGTWPGLGNAVFYSEHQQFTGNLGVGVGLRWNTRLGPIGVDYGVGREGGRGYLTFRQTF